MGGEALMDPAARGGMTGCARGARPRGVTPAPFPKFAEIFRRRRYCHEAGGWFGFTRPIFVLRTGYWVLGRDRCRAVARLAPARGRVWPVRAAPLRNTQYESISSVSSRRDPGAPRLQNPHPPLRFRFAQPRSTQYFVLGTQIRLRRIFNCSLLTAFGVLSTQCSLRSHAARRLRRLAPST